MLILAIETTGPVSSVALNRDGIITEIKNEDSYSHLQQLMPMIKRLMDEEEVQSGMVLEEKDNIADETHFYYCEHLPTLNNRLEVLDRDGDRILFKITGECCDVNYYDGSKGNNLLEITAWIDKE